MKTQLPSGQNLSGIQGFTLFELIVVVVIIGMMTTLAIPRLRQSVFENQLKKSSRKVVGLIAKVSQKAVRDQEWYQLNFDISENRIWLEGSDNKQYDVSLSDEVSIVDILVHDPDKTVQENKSSTGQAEILFTPKGYVTKTLIHLQDDDGELTIFLSPFLGVTKIFDSYVDFQDVFI